MACVDEEQKPSFKHYCRVCKKGFMCGRALGGHMRAHGIGDDRANMDDDDDDDEASDWEENHGDNKRMYQLRANPNRLKSTRVCENCGKEFLSWKSFLEHGKYCGSDDAYDDHSLVSSPCSDGEEYNIGERKGYGWSKRKRSLRTKVGTFTSSYNTNNTYSSEQEDLLLAKWLIDLANSRVDPLTIEPEESCASASKDEEKRNPIMTYLSTSGLMNQDKDLEHHRKSDFFILPSLDEAKVAPKGLFECKACKKVFNSHQALGGHRASHKKVKGCYAAKQDQLDDNNTHDQDNYFKGSKSSSYNYQFEQGSSLTGASRKKSKVHECSICHRVFSTGQALGGHKRCHWITSNSQDSSIFTPKFHFHNPLKQINERSTLENQDPLDLNIPPNDQNMSRIRQEPWKIINPFEVSTDIHMHPWSSTNSDHTKKETKDDVVHHNNNDQPREENEDDNFKNKNNNNNNTNKNNNVRQDNATQINVEDDDEADSKLKLAKLSDLNDINTSSANHSQWLQVGIGPTNKVEADS
ncbi:zinc finger protein ZAT4-like [Solanum stenotomum]|uniref:zinc finger protein ZAT4-like n=1 Tax=Solanum stenotomum TaxID=172797 RepID=UPI0020D0EF11|nr:zinc finger protein ZAT4-like [Solanum stenotomum]